MKHWLARDVDGSLWIYKGRKPKINEHSKRCADAKPISNTVYLRMQKEKEKK